jgi:RNA polymerase sigma-70 factor, ECF subfamily
MQPAVVSAAPEDGDVIALLRAEGRERAFALLLPRYEHKVYRLCCALLRDSSQAQDAAQESLVRIWKALPDYDGRASLSSWIYAITRNRCLTAIARRRELASMSDAAIEAEAEITASEQLAAGADSETDDDASATLRELIDLLPERYRRTLMLFYYEERSVSEVAGMLGMPEGTVKTNLYRARAALTEQLRRRGLDDPRHWLESA